jgi:hypothetical protein
MWDYEVFAIGFVRRTGYRHTLVPTAFSSEHGQLPLP